VDLGHGELVLLVGGHLTGTDNVELTAAGDPAHDELAILLGYLDRPCEGEGGGGVGQQGGDLRFSVRPDELGCHVAELSVVE